MTMRRMKRSKLSKKTPRLRVTHLRSSNKWNKKHARRALKLLPRCSVKIKNFTNRRKPVKQMTLKRRRRK